MKNSSRELARSLPILLLLFGLNACSSSPSPDEAAGLAPLPSSWSFEGRPGVESYRVQAWAGRRLLFEVTVADTVVELTPSLKRAANPFEDVELEIRALDASGKVLGDAWRHPTPARRSAEPG